MKNINLCTIVKAVSKAFILSVTVLYLPLFAHGMAVCSISTPSGISINICQPTENALADNDLKIGVTINSTYELKQVKATVEDRETSLTFSDCACRQGWVQPCLQGWAGTISLTGLSRGQKILTVIVTDVFDNSTQAQRTFTYDKKPHLTGFAPLAETVARPQLYTNATCIDDDPVGCISIKVRVNDFIVATGISNIDQTISLSAYDGQSVTLQFEALDSAGQNSFEERTIYVESSTRLVEIESVGGRIWDVQPERILFLESSGGTNILKIRERSSGQETIVMNESGKIPQYGFLTPKGAIFAEQSGDVFSDVLYEWRDGALVNVDTDLNSNDSLKVKGQYAIWNKPQLYLRDLISGINILIPHPFGTYGTGNCENDVAANGDVVYWSNEYEYNIFRYRSGNITQLTEDRYDSGIWNTYPLTDGINVVYRKHTPCCGNQTYTVTMYGPSGEIILTSARSQDPHPYRDYQLNNGWIAYTDLDMGNRLQVWVRSPSGEISKITYFGTSSCINSIGPNGEVTFTNSKRLYLDTEDVQTMDIASSLGSDYGKSYWLDGQFYMTIGRSLFRVETTPEIVSTPNIPSGTNNGTTDTSYSYSTGGSTSSLGHSVEYQFDWKGDGSDLSSWGSATQSKTWTVPGTYYVKAKARCATHTSVESSWSSAITVIISTTTVTTNPSGLQIIVDGSTYTAPQTFDWTPGSSHNLSVSSLQSGTSGTRYIYSSWSDGGAQTHTVTAPSSSSTYTANFTTQYSLTTSVSPSGTGIITPSGTNWYDSGQNVSVSATANPGYTFSGWSGDLSGTPNPTSITMNGPKNAVANFTSQQYTVTTSVSPSGAGTVSGAGTYNAGVLVTVTATASSGYTFSNWTEGTAPNSISTANPYVFTINGNRNLVANFVSTTPQQYTLTTSVDPVGVGSVTGSGTYNAGTVVTVTAVANVGFTFSFWSGDTSGSSNPVAITMNRNMNVIANFTTISETVSTASTPSGPTSGFTGTSYSYTTGGSSSSYGHSVEYQFDWKGDGSDLSPWGAATRSKIWTAVGTRNVRARARCIVDTSVMSDWSGSIQVIIASSRSTRTLPLSCTPSLPLTVAIAINPGAATQAYSAEDSPPSGWTVSNINENGRWDDGDKKVKWGVFFDNNPRTLTYQVTPPVGETGVKSFSGQVSFDGVNEVIGGDSTFGGCSTGPITPQSPSDNTPFDACSLYSPPTFSWTAAETFRGYEIQFSPDNSFSSIPVKVKTTTSEATITSRTWKRVLLTPEGSEGTVYWRVVGTRANRTKFTSEFRSIIIDTAQAVGNPNISSTSKGSPPELSWENNCNTKFKVWFESDEQFSKKKAFVFNIKNPDDNEGEFTKVLTSGQWMAIRRVVGDTAGSTIYWYIESWDGLKRYNKADVMSFVLTE